jgi:hypothetical protein
MGNEVLQDLYRARAPEDTHGYAIPSDHWGEEFPGIFEILAKMEFAGKNRKLGRLTIKVEPGGATIGLFDDHSGQMTFYTDVTVTEALRGLERAITGGTADWRKSRPFKRA